MLKELKKRADELGIEYPKNITAEKLEQKIIEFENQEDNKLAEETKVETKNIEEPKKELTPLQKAMQKRMEAEKLQYVVITPNDERDKEDEVCFLGFGNKYFELARLVPFGQPIWLERGLVDLALATRIPQHIQELDKNGRPTGNKRVKLVSRYNVSFPEGKDITYEEFMKKRSK